MNEKYIRHMTLGNGTEYWYDANGNKCQTKFSDGSELWYDSNGKLIHKKFTDKSEEWYDADGNKIHEKFPDNYESWHDADGKHTLRHGYRLQSGQGKTPLRATAGSRGTDKRRDTRVRKRNRPDFR